MIFFGYPLCENHDFISQICLSKSFSSEHIHDSVSELSCKLHISSYVLGVTKYSEDTDASQLI